MLNFYTKKVMLSNKDILLGFKNNQVPKTRLNHTLCLYEKTMLRTMQYHQVLF